jgi:radical SAM protein with 4Fe4S-binding SPASM domain
VTQIRGSWQRTIAAAQRLRERKVTVVLKAPVMGMNVETLEAAAEAARAIGCDFTADPKVTSREDGELSPLALRAGDAELRRFYTSERLGVWQEIAKTFGQDCGGGADLDSTPCHAGQGTAGITPQGLLSACHSIMRPGGDLRRQSFREVWLGSPEIVRIRELTWRKIEECNVCEVRAYCSRCHAMADLEDGKIDGPSREACRHAVILRDLLRERGLAPAGADQLPPPLRRAGIRPAALRVIG